MNRPAEQTKSTVVIVNTVAPPPFIGGAERSIVAMAQELVSANYAVVLVGLCPRGSIENADEETLYDNISLIRLPIRNLYWPWSSQRRGGFVGRSLWQLIDIFVNQRDRRLAELYRRISPSLVIVNNMRGWGLSPWNEAKRRNLPILHVIRDYGLICNKSTMYRDNQRCDTLCADCKVRMIRARRSWPDGIIGGVSRAVIERHWMFGLFNGCNYFVFPPAVDARQRREGLLCSSRNSIQSETDRAEANLKFGYLGRVGVEKGVDLLADASAALSLVVRVAGFATPSYKVELEKRSGGWLNFVGERNAIEFIEECDVLVVPSVWFEPFGRVVAEAAALGCRVVIADAPGLVEAAEQSRAEYITFRMGDSASLIQVLSSVRNGQAAFFVGNGGEASRLVEVVRSLIRER